MTLPFKTIDQLPIGGKQLLIREDFNVPITPEGKVADDTRIRMSLPTIEYALSKNCKIILMSHLGRPKGTRDPRLTLRPVAETLSNILGKAVTLAPDCIGPEAQSMAGKLEAGRVLMLENLRFHREETQNNPSFAQAIASLGEVYIDDAFGAVHRAHASVASIPDYVKVKGAGFLLKKEVEALTHVLEAKTSRFVLILGGAKVSDKLGVLNSLMDKAQIILVGGAMAYTFLKVKGIEVGNSLVEKESLHDAEAISKKAFETGTVLGLPVDHVIATEIREDAPHKTTDTAAIPSPYIGVDIGPKTIEAFSQHIRTATMIFWNGPMGVFEMAPFSRGTYAIARAVGASAGESVVGGGDSIRAIHESGAADQITHISSGGGASLEFLEGKTLPGIQALKTH